MDMLHATKEEKLGKQRIVLNPKINVAVSGIIIQKEEWFQAQFIQSDPEQEEPQVHLLKRLTSNLNWFVWPELCGEEPDITWTDEGMFHFLISLWPQFCITCNLYNIPIGVLCETSEKKIKE